MSQFLYVKVINGARLLAADFGTSSDPFVSVSVGGVTKKTSVKNNTLTPVWNESFVFPVEDLSAPAIFKVMDSDTFGSDSLGAFQFNLRRLRANSDEVMLFKLYGGEHGGNILASLHSQVAKTKKGATSTAMATAATGATGNAQAGKWMTSFMDKVSTFGEASKEGDTEEEKANVSLGQSLDPGFLGSVDANFGVIAVAFRLFDSQGEAEGYDLPIPEPKGQLTIRLVGGRNLISTDLGSRPCADPYVTFNIGNERAESSAVSNSVHPHWSSELIGMNNIQMGEQLVVTCWDNDRGPSEDDQMGEAVIDPSLLQVGQETFCIVRLTGGGRGENISAIINDEAAPLSQNIAAFSAEAAIGGPAGKLAGSVIQKIPGGEEEDDNKGTICLGLTLSEPLGDGTPSPTLPGTPSSNPRPYKAPPPTGQEESHGGLEDLGHKASNTLNSLKSKFGGFF